MSLGSVIRFLVTCLVLGLILAALGATPSSLGVWLANSAQSIGHFMADFIRWGGGYMVLGAMVLLPYIVLRWIFKKRRKE